MAIRFPVCVAAAVLLLAIVSTASAKYSGGSGTAQDPYQIATAADLLLLGDNHGDYDKHFVLTADIDLDPALPGRRPFGMSFIGTFTGVFDGGGHEISHLTIKCENKTPDGGPYYLGLFGRLESGAEVKDLAIVDVSIAGLGSYSGGVGALVGNNMGTLARCYSTGVVTNGVTAGQHYLYVGGLVGVNKGTVTQCYSTAAVSGAGGPDSSVGGLVGENDGAVTQCYSTGAVSSLDGYVGGLVGINGRTVTQCYSTGVVGRNGSHRGGLLGFNGGSVLNSVWDMERSGLSGSAGGVGLTTVEMHDPHVLGLNGFGNDPNWVLDAGRDYPRLAWEGTPGQIIPEPQVPWPQGRGTAEDPYRVDTAEQLILLGKSPILWGKHFALNADIDLNPALPGRQVFGQAVIPAFTGVFAGKGHTISHLSIMGETNLGLFGRLASGAEVKDLGVVDAKITGSGTYVGGMVGYNYGWVTRCYSTGVVSGNSHVGGLVGQNWQGNVTQCYSTSAVSGTGQYSSVGGLVGLCSMGAVIQCYSTGTVSGNRQVGGLMGGNGGGFVTQCYSIGAVSGNSDVGGLVGSGGGVESNCFWDTQTARQPTSVGGTGKTTAQMYDISTYRKAGWDFRGERADGWHEAWQFPPGGGYPVLAIFNGYTPPQLRGSGAAGDPYLIANAAELGAMIHYSPCAHYRLTTSIDLSGIRWGTAVVPWFSGTFDGNGCTISHLTIEGGDNLGLVGRLTGGIKDVGVLDVNITGSGDCVGGLVAYSVGSLTACYSTGAVRGQSSVGGLVGDNEGGVVIDCHAAATVGGTHGVGGLVGSNHWGEVTRCDSRGAVSGSTGVGGLVGFNAGDIVRCYSTGAVNGKNAVGGLVGRNGVGMPDGGDESVVDCYSVGVVTGELDVGGLAGLDWGGAVTHCYSIGAVRSSGRMTIPLGCFWDTQTSGQRPNGTNTGKTTAEMQTAKTFLDAGWDFVGETKNGTEDIWWILEGKNYPRLTWEQGERSEPRRAFAPYPLDGATDVPRSPILRWAPGEPLLSHDVYVGDDKEVVANATTTTLGAYRGRYPPEVTTFAPGALGGSATYYWRVDEVNEVDPGSPWKGSIWSFTTTDFDFMIVSIVDDFESYTDDKGSRIYQTWIDGPGPDPNIPGNGTGAYVGYNQVPFAEQTIVHGDRQSMPMDYNNTKMPFYSETERTWATAQDWTVDRADTLTLYFRGNGNPLSFLESDGVVRMSGSGNRTVGDYSGDFDVDMCRFAYKRLNGSGSIVAKVENAGGLYVPGAKAGVMIRESLNSDWSDWKPVHVVYTPTQGVVSFGSARNLCGSATVGDAETPLWVKLTRTGDVFTAQYSPDGKTWTDIRDAKGQVASRKVAMTSGVYIGLCVTSSDPEVVATAVFSSIGTTGEVTGGWQVAPIGYYPQTLNNAPQSLYVRIEDGTGKNASVVHPDAEAVRASEWQRWDIALAEVRAAGVDVAAVKKMVIGVGDRKNPLPGGTGRIYIDDLRLTKRMP